MNKKKLIGLLFFLVIILLLIFTVILIINGIKSNAHKKELREDIYSKLELIIKGNVLEANMNFIDNYKNTDINKTYKNLSEEELIEKGYVEYIQDTDYKIEFYSKITIDDISILEEKEQKINIKIVVKRPNLYKIMDECDLENKDNPNYDFNSEIINKIKGNTFDYENKNYEITVYKLDDDIKFEYTDTFIEMIDGEKI